MAHVGLKDTRPPSRPFVICSLFVVLGSLSYLWLVGNGGMGYNYNYYYYHSSVPY